MLKTRLVCCLILQDELLVQSIGFRKYLPIGKAKTAVEFMTNWDIDEIVILDMTATTERRKPNLDLISHVSKKCFVPLTAGGGISSVEDVKNLIRAGADKVCINHMALQNAGFISESAKFFGSQCIVISIDAKRNTQGGYEVYADSGERPTGLDPVSWARTVEEYGAGEILLNSIDRDGAASGYDVALVRSVAEAVQIPVIACGGVGVMNHFVEGLVEGKASAVAAANIFQHVEHSAIVAKSYMKNAGIDVRLSTLAKYTGFVFDKSGRILKKSDAELEQIWMEKFKQEII